MALMDPQTAISPSALYQYRQLRKPDSFRLLHLAPSTHRDQPMIGHLEEHEIESEECPAYRALSYTWGDADPPTQIQLDDCTLPITRNLHEALLHLRDSTEAIVVWIDAICINQRDDTEKSRQVARMREVFHGAKDVIVWLGPEIDTTQVLF